MQTARVTCQPAGAPAATRAGEHAGYEGCWIAGAAAEVFVGVRPRPRVLVFRRRGGVSLFRAEPDSRAVGVRTWFMEPEQDSRSPLPAEQPAVFDRTGDREVTVTARPDPTTGLQLRLRVALDPRRARLWIEHALVNHGAGRTLALWPVMAFPGAGAGFSPFETWPHALRPLSIKTCLLWPDISPAHPALELGCHGMGLRFTVPGDSIKVGLKSRAGAAVYAGGGDWLFSTVSSDPAARHPEGDGNVTMFFNGRSDAAAVAELEHVGPLVELPPGGQTSLRQELRLREYEPLAPGGVDAWIVQARRRTMTAVRR